MSHFRALVRLIGLVAVTGGSVLIPLAARVVTLNSPRVVARVGSRASSLWSRLACATIGIRVRSHGRPSGATYLVAANHISYLDIWVLGSLYTSVFVAKHEIRSWPLFGWISNAAGTLFVNRSSARDAVRVNRAIREHLASGVSVTLFPEGGTSSGRSVQPFLPTLLEPAAAAGVPCFGASLSYDTPASAEPPVRTICWNDGENFVAHIWRIMRMPSVVATVHFSRVPVRDSDRKELARQLWEHVQGTFVPIREEAESPRCAP